MALNEPRPYTEEKGHEEFMDQQVFFAKALFELVHEIVCLQMQGV